MKRASLPAIFPSDFRVKVRQGSSGCWLWRGTRSAAGYGLYWNRKAQRTVPAHRFAYELLNGPVSRVLHIDHLCRVHERVNPAHLDPVTPRINILRGAGFAAENAKQTHCKRGHEFTPENTVIKERGGLRRNCRICRNEGDRRRYHALAADAHAAAQQAEAVTP